MVGWEVHKNLEFWPQRLDKSKMSPIILSDNLLFLSQSRARFWDCRELKPWYLSKQTVHVTVQTAYWWATWAPWLQCPEEFTNWRSHNIQWKAWFLNRVIYSDGFGFHLDGEFNNHNGRNWGTENPHQQRQIARDSEKVAIRCAMSVSRVRGM